jgi:uncharacterized protein YecE (DUF72 family)
MEFGRLSDIDDVDFTLPPDHPSTKAILKGKAKAAPKIYMGCAKWGRTDWVGKLYPKGTKEKDFLANYAKHFSSIELNATHYRIFDPATVRKWKDTVGENSGFKFCPKFYQGISHWKRLKEAEEETKQFYASLENLGNTLGPFFLQLHQNFGPKNLGDIEKYLKTLPKHIPVHLELRHPDWFVDSPVVNEAFTIFKELGIGTVITDAAGRRDCVHMRLTTPVAFIRFVGNQLHPTDYTRIDDWVKRIKKWLDEGLKELYFFMHQHEELYSPELSAYTIDQLNKHCKLGLKPIKLIQENNLFE